LNFKIGSTVQNVENKYNYNTASLKGVTTSNISDCDLHNDLIATKRCDTTLQLKGTVQINEIG